MSGHPLSNPEFAKLTNAVDGFYEALIDSLEGLRAMADAASVVAAGNGEAGGYYVRDDTLPVLLKQVVQMAGFAKSEADELRHNVLELICERSGPTQDE